MTPPPIVHLGFDSCGGEALARLFHASGLPVLCWDKGRPAREALWRAATGAPAPADWRGARLICELHDHDGYARPPAEAFREVAWLTSRLPEAVFLMTTRDRDGWIADRMAAATLRRSVPAMAYHRGVAPQALPDLWAADWDAHLAAVRAHLDGAPNYHELDLTGLSWEAMRQALRPLAPDLDRLPPLTAREREAPVLHWGPRAAAPRPAAPARITARTVDTALLDVLVPHCLGRLAPAGRAEVGGASPLYLWSDGAGGQFTQDGARWPVAWRERAGTGEGAGPLALIRPNGAKVARLEAVLTEMARLGRRAPFQVDMQDARRHGAPEGGPALSHPMLAYTRRAGARNMVLWPLADYHAIGNPLFAQEDSDDRLSFDDKRDELIWRGALSGSSTRPDGRPGAGPARLLAQIADPATPRLVADAARRALRTLPRLAVLRRFAGRPGMDLGLRLPQMLAAHAEDPEIAPFLRPALTRPQMLACRWQLCLSGYDVGSNFVWAAQSQSVVLAEESGWEAYFSALFRPWEHYIPLAPLAADLEAALDWGRSHLAACREMSRAARAQVRRLACPVTRAEMLRAVADALPEAPPPFRR